MMSNLGRVPHETNRRSNRHAASTGAKWGNLRIIDARPPGCRGRHTETPLVPSPTDGQEASGMLQILPKEQE
jgi:hypothetical protein